MRHNKQNLNIEIDENDINKQDLFDQSPEIINSKLLNNPDFSINRFSFLFDNVSFENQFKWTQINIRKNSMIIVTLFIIFINTGEVIYSLT